jgi:hypothetical protein
MRACSDGGAICAWMMLHHDSMYMVDDFPPLLIVFLIIKVMVHFCERNFVGDKQEGYAMARCHENQSTVFVFCFPN